MTHRTLEGSLKLLFPAALVLSLVAFAACGGNDDGDDQAEMAAAEEGEDLKSADGPRVFFANVSEGDEVTSPVHLEFGIENFEIVPAQDPPVLADGEGHHHLGIDTDCLAPGIVIEKAAPWIHFGTGDNWIDMQLPPGPAHLALQVGDAEHRTLDEDGLCATINLVVVEGEAATEEEGEEQ